MIERVLTDRAGVDGLRRSLARERALFEVRTGDAGPDWQPVDGGAPFAWDAPSALAGAKRFFFAPRETLLRWHAASVEPVWTAPPPFVLFGVPACDLAAIAHQDRFFAEDPWYVGRRRAALLVGLDCLTACAGGFCRDVDAGPFARGGFDLDLTALDGDRVVIGIGTEAGRRALVAAGLASAPLDEATAAQRAAAERRSIDSFPDRPFVAAAIDRLRGGRIADDEWETLGPACFACTGCTSVCPTCSCFTMTDRVQEDGGARARLWDSCLLEGFQREASGHHPTPRPGDRVRRFWYHKLSDDFVPPCPRIGCVGCGRCDVTCPGSIGALHVLRKLGEA
jgi:formate hydrogenlyase subunit 6/NADH:ubiquinone oxidoreductase subunit I